MAQFDLFVDSAANIPDLILAQKEIRVIPYVFLVNGEEQCCVRKNFREAAREFYASMRQGADVRTSLLTAEVFCDALIPSLEAGRDVFLITLSSGISGTFAQAQKAKKMLEEAYPQRTVVVADSANASMGEGLLAIRVADLRALGESAEACAQWFEENRYKIHSVFTVGDLRYLRKGGRINAAVAFAGSLLGIKPILKADGSPNTKMVFAGKERGRKKAIEALARAYASLADKKGTVAITHADCEEDAWELARLLRENGAEDIIIEYYDLCTGSHVGPDTIALFFWGEDRRDLPKTKEAFAAKRLPQKV